DSDSDDWEEDDSDSDDWDEDDSDSDDWEEDDSDSDDWEENDSDGDSWDEDDSDGEDESGDTADDNSDRAKASGGSVWDEPFLEESELDDVMRKALEIFRTYPDAAAWGVMPAGTGAGSGGGVTRNVAKGASSQICADDGNTPEGTPSRKGSNGEDIPKGAPLQKRSDGEEAPKGTLSQKRCDGDGALDSMPFKKSSNGEDTPDGKPPRKRIGGGNPPRGERMLVTQALDERDLLVKKIDDKINAASFVDTVKCNEEKVLGAKLPVKEFETRATAAYQQIRDLITRFEKIDAAIVASNAVTTIETSYGTYTVAAAIALRSRIRAKGNYGERADFETRLYKKMKAEYQQRVVFAEDKNKQMQSTAESMRLSILGRDSKGKDNNTLEVVDTFVRENTTELADPLDIRKKMEAIAEKQALLESELETKIKVSNATTFIEI
ncbi:MAG: hypothetical protein LUG93_04855, partial [Lachnospiraceae bacterium]|nr:hypothetical protein [Lachnospiraceae bacterium]